MYGISQERSKTLARNHSGKLCFSGVANNGKIALIFDDGEGWFDVRIFDAATENLLWDSHEPFLRDAVNFIHFELGRA